MNLEQAEQIAKNRMREFFLDRQDDVKSISQRLVFYSEKQGNDWVVILGILPRNAQSFDEFKKSPNLDDSETQRARDWLRVVVTSEGGCEQIEEVNPISELL